MPTFADLPAELIQHITSFLEPRIPRNHSFHDNLVRIRRARLSTLARTCRTFATCVRPLLYASIGPDINPRLLLRTLIAHPDYGDHVHEIDARRWWMNGAAASRLSPDEHRAIDEAAARFGMVDRDGFPHDLRSAVGNQAYYITDALQFLVVLHCPYVREVSLVMSLISPGITRPIALDHLRVLKLAYGQPKHGAFIGQSYSWLFDAAPNLRELKGHYIRSFSSEICHQNISEVSFKDSDLVESDFTAVFSNFPALHTFRYHSGGKDMSRAPVALESLSSAMRINPHLKTMGVDSQRYADEVPAYLQDGSYLASLSDMGELETIDISIEEVSNLERDDLFYSTFFPRSVRYLILRGARMDRWNKASLEAAVKGPLPNLQSVTLVDVAFNAERKEEWKGRFAALGVTLRYVEEMGRRYEPWW